MKWIKKEKEKKKKREEKVKKVKKGNDKKNYIEKLKEKNMGKLK